jgi:Tfp pilus assembly protein PilZ
VEKNSVKLGLRDSNGMTNFYYYLFQNSEHRQRKFMKNLKTPFLKMTAFLFLGFPLIYALFELTLLDVPFPKVMHSFFTPSFWLFSAIGMMTGYGFYEMKRWSWNLFLFSSFLIVYSNALVLSRYSASQNKLIVFLVTLVLQGLLIYRLGKEVRVPYFLPRIRWWESNPRYKMTIPVKLDRVGTDFSGEIMDLSVGGCFVKSRHEFTQDEVIQVQFELFGEELKINGMVVWRSKSSVTHPKGVGVKFETLTLLQKKILKAGLAQVKKLNQVQASRGKMSPEEYSRKIHQLKTASLNISSKDKDRAS